MPDLLIVQAGISYTGNRPDIDKDTDTRSGAVNGARNEQSNATLDGVDVNDQVNRYAFTSVLPVTLDSEQEIRDTTSSYNANEGTGSGARVASVTKSGTNVFHGSGYEYKRSTITSANDYFLKQSQLANGLPNKPDQLIRNIEAPCRHRRNGGGHADRDAPAVAVLMHRPAGGLTILYLEEVGGQS